MDKEKNNGGKFCVEVESTEFADRRDVRAMGGGGEEKSNSYHKN